MHRAVPSLFALAVVLLPRSAWACPVCGQGRDGTEGALLVMSGVLSALPLLMAGGIVTWIILRMRAAADEPRADSALDAREGTRGSARSRSS